MNLLKKFVRNDPADVEEDYDDIYVMPEDLKMEMPDETADAQVSALSSAARKDPEIQMIPIIFLTGKNDRDHVFRILQYKPDGYLLKTLSKEALIDSIDRFFSESLFQMSLHHIIEDTD